MESASFYQIELKQPFKSTEENALLQKVTNFFGCQKEHTDIRTLADEFEKLIDQETLSGHFLYATYTKYRATVNMKLNGQYKGAWLEVTMDKDLQE
ncbi:hypothetical protein Q0590_24875 [Rhodocytophaga aerolata]|uniref:Uncharacterized protein n=1 Tax=Rhodocytophaga aerolata TaxID=455078 RepID=A0ABT8RBR2_9BACT|nr:hypothetical protein [Rhodocytophaga aerolata]MDO1449534.1 hypothetical protein [Rhodocytophaga aerolata]